MHATVNACVRLSSIKALINVLSRLCALRENASTSAQTHKPLLGVKNIAPDMWDDAKREDADDNWIGSDRIDHPGGNTRTLQRVAP